MMHKLGTFQGCNREAFNFRGGTHGPHSIIAAHTIKNRLVVEKDITQTVLVKLPAKSDDSGTL